MRIAGARRSARHGAGLAPREQLGNERIEVGLAALVRDQRESTSPADHALVRLGFT